MMADSGGLLRLCWKTKLTSLRQLAVTMIAHFGHAVFHVFQRISVPGATPANNLRQITHHLSTNKASGAQEVSIACRQP